MRSRDPHLQVVKESSENKKMTGETPEVRSDKRKPKEKKEREKREKGREKERKKIEIL